MRSDADHGGDLANLVGHNYNLGTVRKRLAVAVILTCVAYAFASDHFIDIVAFDGSITGGTGQTQVKIVTVAAKKASYTLKCNDAK